MDVLRKGPRMPATILKHPHSAHTPPASNEDMPDMPFEEGAHDALDPDLRHRLISEAAYYLYVERGYAEGYDLDDWLQAETQIDHTILNPDRVAVSEEAEA